MSSIIVAVPPYTGELQPLLQIAGALVERGHAVTVLTGSRFGTRVAAVGARFAPLSGAADFDDRRFVEEFPEVAEMMANAKLDDEQYGTLEDQVVNQNPDDPAAGVEAWIADNRDWVDSLKG